MKFMKLGTRPDTFYTEEATRTVISDAPTDLIIKINNITYLIHKFPLLPNCGLLQRLCSNNADKISIELHDIPGGDEAFELCAKFCYGITINLSAHNFVSAFCAAKFLQMSEESTANGNFIAKLETFFLSCILAGWKDTIVALRSAVGLSEWSDNLGITRKCIDSIVEKILTPPPKVTWSYTYTRPGYNKKTHRSVPKDWWTEDIADLDVDLFRCIIVAISSTCMLPPPLIGEALHVYACRWLPDISAQSNSVKNRQILETLISLIPPDQESISVSFSLRLLSLANLLGASSVTKTEVIMRCSALLEEATVSDLLFASHSASNDDGGDEHCHDVDLVVAVLESFLMAWRRQSPAADENAQLLISIRKVGKLIDSYLQVVARDRTMPVAKMIYLAEALPEVARPNHDDVYKAINIFLKEHPYLSKADKKRLCRVLNCQKLSADVRAHAVKNERLPLRTVVQVLFFEQEKGNSKTSSRVAAASDELRSRPDEKLRRSASTRSRHKVAEADKDEMNTKHSLESRRNP
ncbi:BTB/POZ domain-containing protein At5g47800-like isoform X2 [Cucurbita maxima]|uniref:BTB/POZ domain-containing protein At5g47800-like isoform X2 n=1 Tax=Cucurbita maxima TaxID=3661 RepID=A0A6J1HU26_CUCMA|nr:BTB/POZ domain-containing protein At5g47800-like isoform X2 [Cucurbita maxima]